MIGGVASVALGQYLVLQGVKLNSRLQVVVTVASPDAAHDSLEGFPHVFIPERVDDGVDKGVALRQHQAVLLIAQHSAPVTAQTVQQQHDQAGRPADHKAACGGRVGVRD